MAGEITAATLLTIHNLAHYLDTLRRMRQSILLGRFEEFRTEMRRSLAAPAAEGEGS
jgi:tRNA-guanine family transglycosylase